MMSTQTVPTLPVRAVGSLAHARAMLDKLLQVELPAGKTLVIKAPLVDCLTKIWYSPDLSRMTAGTPVTSSAGICVQPVQLSPGDRLLTYRRPSLRTQVRTMEPRCRRRRRRYRG